MTLRLRVDTSAWEHHVDDLARSVSGLVPVIKGNGYGFGRAELARRAATFADNVAVGTVHELDVPLDDLGVVVLTPTLTPPASTAMLLTVGSVRHIDALTGWPGRVIVKLESSMHRFGGEPALIEIARSAGLEVVGVAVHPPLLGSGADHRADVERWLPSVDPDLEVWVSHLDVDDYRTLPDTHRYRLRLGTALWHGDKSMLQLEAEVRDRRAVSAGDHVGYRQRLVSADGHLLMIGAGSSHGVGPLPDGRSPFHYSRRRLALVEPPHMHTAMAIVPVGDPCPDVGDWVDVQQPLTTTRADVVAWS